MELTDPSQSAAAASACSPLFIDLNEIPSSSSPPEPEPDTYDVVRSILDNQDLPAGGPAPLPEAAVPACGACGAPEEGAPVLVCDGCERGFHLACAGWEPTAEWLCSECLSGGVSSKRWPLGVKSKRILDINSSPPSDGEWEAPEELRVPGSSSCPFGVNAFGAGVRLSNIFYLKNENGVRKGSENSMNAYTIGFEDTFKHREAVDRSLDEVESALSRGKIRSSNTLARVPSQTLSGIFLQSLTQFISERHGVLDDGWRVEFEHVNGGYEKSVTYCSPDGKTFGSMSEVAFHLGLMPHCHQVDVETRRDDSPCHPQRLQLPRKRKSRQYRAANGCVESKESFTNGNKESLSNGQVVIDAKLSEVADAEMGEDMIAEPSNASLPVQFEDFYVLSLGRIDLRPTYHDAAMIWPVGFRSFWHDKVTRSLFLCEIWDGGDSGPVFKVRRLSCSTWTIPEGSTVIIPSNLSKDASWKNKENKDRMFCNMESKDNVELILAEPSAPTESDILACLGGPSNESSVQKSDGLKTLSFLKRPGDSPSSNPECGDEIGDISVEERSSSSAWKTMSQKLVDACSDLSRKGGVMKFFCDHVDDNMYLPSWFAEDGNDNISFARLAKFCSYPSFFNIPRVHQGEFGTLAGGLSKWLEEDRFGLDTEFVQEIIEQLSGAEACAKYEHLTKRHNSSEVLTVANGCLIAKKNVADSEDSFHRCKKPSVADDIVVLDRYPPAGKPICPRVTPAFVGDLYQVWELLWRFHKTLGLEEPLSLEQLGGELMDPLSDGSNPSENLDRNFQSNQSIDLLCAEGLRENLTSLCNLASGADNHAVVNVERVGKDAAGARLASTNHTLCCGASLTKAHCSVLDVLISELQSKVAALVDPNFDSGEPKSRRGRRKDMDNSILDRKSKLNLLPINELTWPELARRYVLAFLAMDGNLDSAEITARESSRVFCCLGGDGGILCGSLTGVVGMEADALLLAEATKQIFGSLSAVKEVLILEDESSDPRVVFPKEDQGNCLIPEWAQLLEPVKKLPTNVGTRIRQCVRDALQKGPPDWAKKRLDHSISKAVYKGNASGPTKKAVLAVLAEVSGEASQVKVDKTVKKKIAIPITDIVMKRCRSVLRQAAAADDEKVFCTLLGRNLLCSGDNADEGLLGSPAMVSRPLDFRTIDLRLSVGAYGGSYDSFLEDVRELWNIVRFAFRDQPDLVEMADKLSQDFESSYETEVLSVVRKFEEYAKLDHISAETKKEIEDMLTLSDNIPKAPWEEGVCKVCGMDKDDDSVLLCDTCDAEYHTYCLDPPLARIPEGNWYCPSCVNVQTLHGLSGNVLLPRQCCSKKHQGEVTRAYLETLRQLAATMEEKDYWEFSVDERIYLLKFLSDELLNSALIRQHLEQCAETTVELQQKLRSLYSEWKNLRSREEFFASRASKADAVAVGSINAKENPLLVKQAKSQAAVNDLGDRPGSCRVFSEDVNILAGGQEKRRVGGLHSDLSGMDSRRDDSCNRQMEDPVHTGDRTKEIPVVVQESEVSSLKDINALELSNSLPQSIYEKGECQFQDKLKGFRGRTASILSSTSQVDSMDNRVAQHVTPVSEDDSHTNLAELSTAKGDILNLQNSIRRIESQLLNLSLRRELLGSDCRGRLYWASVTLDGNPLIVVDASLKLHEGKNLDHGDQWDNDPMLKNCDLSCGSTCTYSEGSKACFPFVYDSDDALTMCHPWVFYQSEAEVEELVGWLKDNDMKERILKESILQWMRPRLQESKVAKNLDKGECVETLSTISIHDETLISNNLTTKAAMVLEKRYGKCNEVDATEMLKKRGKKAKLTGEEIMYRCDCLELIWPSRCHCLSCHRTYADQAEFAEHNNSRCHLNPATSRKAEEMKNSSKMKANVQVVRAVEECINKVDLIRASESCGSDLNSSLVDNRVNISPFDLKEISSKFLTKNSGKDLVQEIGLIGSNGIPSFLSSVSPCVSESTLMLMSSKKDLSASGDEPDGGGVFDAQATSRSTDSRPQLLLDSVTRKTETSQVKLNKPSLDCLKRREKKPCMGKPFPQDRHCVVPRSSLRPSVGKVSHILRHLKVNLLDMEAALSEEGFRLSRARTERRCAWRSYVKSAASIYQMVQATIILEEMINTQFLRNEWWYWSSLSAAAKTSTITALALRIYSLDAAILYDKCLTNPYSTATVKPCSMTETKPLAGSDPSDKGRVTRKSTRKRKEIEG